MKMKKREKNKDYINFVCNSVQKVFGTFKSENYL